LKTGLESLSGLAMDDVRVHHNSAKPAQFQALAYAQGSEIHLASGAERHLPHEAWHVVQQKQGRVSPTTQAKGVSLNADEGLERGGGVRGGKALRVRPGGVRPDAPPVAQSKRGGESARAGGVVQAEIGLWKPEKKDK